MATNNSILYLLSYNNYFNRIVKRENTLEDYLEFSVYEPLVCNFNPADGILTEHKFNTSYLVNTPEADYVLVVNATTQEINSRWFIIGAERQRGGQYHLSLRRDLAADFYNDIINAPCYIEKATVPTISSPLIFNSERFLVNQIKKGETLLKDKTGCGWLVGYVSTQSFPNDITVSIPADNLNFPAPPIPYDTMISYKSNGVYKNEEVFLVDFIGAVGGATYGWGLRADVNGDTWARNIDAPDYYSKILFNVGETDEIRNQTMNDIRTRVLEQKSALMTALYASNEQKETRIRLTTDEYETLLSMNGNTYSDGTNIFTVGVNVIGPEKISHDNITASDGASYNILYDIIDDYSETNPYHPESGSGIHYAVYVNGLTVSVEKASIPAVEGILKSSVAILKDAPYRMFACPVGAPITTLDGVNNITTLNGNLSKNLCSTIATLLGGTGTSFIYDLQYLPYCPAREFIDVDESNRIFLGRGTEDIDYTLIKNTETGEIVQYLLWASKSNFSFVINSPISVPASVVEFKVAHETQFCRLVSPNYNGSFEFKPTSNRGVTGFEVNCTYRPYQPYIHLNPIFNQDGLYGGDYNDERGLVCSGNFSIDIVDDAWIDYQIQNKSYADAFRRQVENMEQTYQIQRAQQKEAGIINVATSAISGVATGIMLGSLKGGPVAGVAGSVAGIAGGALSAYGLQRDLMYAQQLHEESKSYLEDTHNLSLQNIQALPYTLGKVSAFTTNNKIFPFVEFYDATEEEKEILRNKLYFDGMTIGAIGSISNYIGATPSFISAQLLRMTTVPEDYHLVAELANELHKGYYI